MGLENLLQGMVFSPVPFQSNQVVPPGSEQDSEQQGKGLISAFQGIFNDSLTRIFHPNDVCITLSSSIHFINSSLCKIFGSTT